MELRYQGFDQLRNARAFRFEIVAKGAVTRKATVTADMTLFLQYRVGIQDGPSLCAGKLTADLESDFEGSHVLTGDDLRSYTEKRAAAQEKRIEMRRSAGRRRTSGASDRNPQAQS